MKTCFKCGIPQPLSCYYKHAMCRDGHLNKCKECTKQDAADRLAINKLNPVWVDAERERGRIKQRRRRAGIKAAPLRMATTKKEAKLRTRDPLKKKAHVTYNYALRTGKLKRQPCAICGLQKTEGHHEDYSKPLEVIWLCKQHHTELHAARKLEASLAKFLTT